MVDALRDLCLLKASLRSSPRVCLVSLGRPRVNANVSFSKHSWFKTGLNLFETSRWSSLSWNEISGYRIWNRGPCGGRLHQTMRDRCNGCTIWSGMQGKTPVPARNLFERSRILRGTRPALQCWIRQFIANAPSTRSACKRTGRTLVRSYSNTHVRVHRCQLL